MHLIKPDLKLQHTYIRDLQKLCVCVGGGSSDMVGKICPPPVKIGLTDPPKLAHTPFPNSGIPVYFPDSAKKSHSSLYVTN